MQIILAAISLQPKEEHNEVKLSSSSCCHTGHASTPGKNINLLEFPAIVFNWVQFLTNVDLELLLLTSSYYYSATYGIPSLHFHQDQSKSI